MSNVFHNAGAAASQNWNRVKEKMNLKGMPSVKPAEMEFRNLVLKMTQKGDAAIEAMEKRIKRRNTTDERPATEFEIMKRKLKNVPFSDDEKGFLTKEHMEMVSTKLTEARNYLMEVEREAKVNGSTLSNEISKNKDWEEEVKYLNKVGLDVDLDGLLQARKRNIIKDLFYDPEEAERRRRAMEEARRLKEMREKELERQRQLELEERQRKIQEEVDKLERERLEAERKLREEEEEKRRLAMEEDERLRQFAAEKRRLLELERQQSNSDQSKDRRREMMRKFSISDQGNDPLEHSSSRRSSITRDSPFQQQDNPFKKPRSRRASKVGKLNLNAQFEADEKVPWSRNTSRQGSRQGSRRGSLSESSAADQLSHEAFAQGIGSALAGLQDLADRAKNYEDEE